MDAVTEDFFVHAVAPNMWDELKTQVHDDAVRFSFNARKPSQMFSLMQWWEYAVGELLLLPQPSAEFAQDRSAHDGEGPDARRQAEVLFPDPQSPVADDGSFKTKGLRDPFWFLWAAPYIIAGYPQIGGAEQITGGSTL